MFLVCVFLRAGSKEKYDYREEDLTGYDVWGFDSSMNMIYIGHSKSYFVSSLANTFSFPCQVFDIN